MALWTAEFSHVLSIPRPTGRLRPTAGERGGDPVAPRGGAVRLSAFANRERAVQDDGRQRGRRSVPELLQQAAASFGLLASTMRLHIVWVLSQGEADVGTLAERVGGTLQAVSQHLAKLKLAGMVSNRREGRRQVYGVDDSQVATLVRLMVEKLDPGEGAAGPAGAAGGDLLHFRSSGA